MELVALKSDRMIEYTYRFFLLIFKQQKKWILVMNLLTLLMTEKRPKNSSKLRVFSSS